ncbi:hypothetical protein Afe04nite_26750 [Asanoa ferruginea]|nr:hypothetical protein Afe04nite_26750 [Asanoa ferruginea]
MANTPAAVNVAAVVAAARRRTVLIDLPNGDGSERALSQIDPFLHGDEGVALGPC